MVFTCPQERYPLGPKGIAYVVIPAKAGIQL